MGTIKLKLCPFCGNEAEMEVNYIDTYRCRGYWIQGKCVMCGAKSKSFFTPTPYPEVDNDELREMLRAKREGDKESVKIYHERYEKRRIQMVHESDAMKQAIRAWNTRIGEVNDTE